MNGPNKTVAKAAARRPFDSARQAQKDAAALERRDPLIAFVCERALIGEMFATMEEAQEAFDEQRRLGI